MTTTNTTTTEIKIKCQICGFEAHTLEQHLKEEHNMKPETYRAGYGGPMVSPWAIKQLDARMDALINDSPVKISLNIKDVFGVSMPVESISAFSKPHESTPTIDPDYVFNKSLLHTVLFALGNKNERVLLTGPTGSGKSSVVEQTIARLNLKFCRVNCDGDMTRADFVGQWVLKGKEMVFQDGLLPKAMREGMVLLIDEWDAANPSVSLALQSVLEEGGKLTITETREVVKPHANFRVFATANTKGQGDESGMYHGTQPQNYAALDRFSIVDIVDYPTPDVEKQIITRKTGIEYEPKNKVLEKLVEYAILIRTAFKKEEIACTMSTRTLVNIARKLIAFGDVKRAYEVAFINKCNTEDAEFSREIMQRVWDC